MDAEGRRHLASQADTTVISDVVATNALKPNRSVTAAQQIRLLTNNKGIAQLHAEAFVELMIKRRVEIMGVIRLVRLERRTLLILF